MTRRERPESVVQRMMICLCAHMPIHKLVLRGSRGGFASRQKVWARPADSVLDYVCNEGGEKEGGGEAQERDMEFMGFWRRGGREEDVQCDCEGGKRAGIEEEVGDGDALGVCVWEGDAAVVEAEKAVEGLEEEDCEVLESEEEDAEPIGDVGTLWRLARTRREGEGADGAEPAESEEKPRLR